MIDETPEGATLNIPTGTYTGNFSIAKPMIIDGNNQVVIDGSGIESVLTISSHHVTVRNLTVKGSGDSADRMDAAILISGDRHLLEHVRVEDSLYGIMAKETTHSVFRRNFIELRNVPTSARGDGIRLWNSTNNDIIDNTFHRVRDIALNNSPENRLRRNHISDSRIGFDFVFSGNSIVEDNELTQNLVGMAVLYSNGLEIRRNRISHMFERESSGITIKESFPTTLEENDIVHCSVGIVSNSGSDPNQSLYLRKNHLKYNGIGVRAYGVMGSLHANDNVFKGNLITAVMPLDGDPYGNAWHGNDWDEYQGFDRNNDGIGDYPFEYYRYADRIWMETPEAMFFLNSPLFEMIDFLERLAPFSSPHLQLVDPKPRLSRDTKGAVKSNIKP